MALVWTAALGLAWLRPTSSWAQAPELGAPLFGGLLLIAASQLLLPLRAQLARAAGLAALSAAALLLVRELSTVSWAQLLGNAQVGGTSALGQVVLCGWLLMASMAGTLLNSRRTPMLALGLICAAVSAIVITAVGSFLLSAWLMLGMVPGSQVLLSPSLAVSAGLLSLSLVLSGWAQVDRHDERAPNEAYRWAFARRLALLLSTNFVAGLAATALTGAQSVDLLADGLANRAERRAQTLLLFVERNSALVRALHHTRSKEQAQVLLLALRETAKEFQLSDSRPLQATPSWPLLKKPDFRADLLSDSSILIEFSSEGPARFVRLLPRQLPAFLGRTATADTTAMESTPLLCSPAEQSQFDCAELRATDEPEFKSATLTHLRLVDRHHSRLTEVADGQPGKMLGLSVGLGSEGSVLLLKLDAATVFRALGAPILAATGLLTLLALIASCISCWRQLPRLRALYHSRAQGEATMRQLPLAVLVVDENQLIIQANAAASQLLDSDEPSLLGRNAAQLFVDGLPNCQDLNEQRPPVRRCILRDVQGRAIPVELNQTSFQVAGRCLTQLLLRDLRSELRDAGELLRWRSIFDESGWGMALGSVGQEPALELVNSAYARMLGYLPAELVGRPIRQLVAPALWDRLLFMRAEVSEGRTVQGPLRHRRRDGTEIPTLVSMSGVRNAEGQLTHYMVSVQDISALKQAEEDATRNALHLRAVLDALPVGVWIGDSQGGVQQTNRAARHFWPTGSDGLPQGRDHESLMRRAAITRSQISGQVVELPQQDGSVRSLLTLANPIVDGATDRVSGAIAIDEDLTHLRRGESALRVAHELLERILQSCAVGIALIDGEGHLLRSNPAWTLLIGEAAKEHLLEHLLDPDDPLRQRGLLTRIAAGELPTYFGEHRIRRVNGQYGWALLVASRLDGHSEQTAKVLVQLMDIDERRRANEEIAASQLRLAVAQKLARVGDWQWHVGSGQFSCSEQMLTMLGRAPARLGRLSRDQLLALVRPEDSERLSAALDRALLNLGRLSEDIGLLRDDGQALMVHLQGVTQRTPEGMTMTGTLQDITERKHIEEELRLSRERLRELMAYEDLLIAEERKRIAREVHDELGQLLTALRMDLSLLRTDLPADSPADQRAARMRETMGTMTEVVRHVAANLRPAALDLGLVAAIEWLAEDFSLRWEIHVELQLPREHEPRLTEAVALAMFRAVQESLTNIAKHAQATQVAITLSEDDAWLLLRVVDDGRGFDPQEVAARRGSGLGLLGMRERMHAIGASLDIRSASGGTTVEIRYYTQATNGHDRTT